MGTSWISRNGWNLRKGGGVDLEKGGEGGGMNPLTNYDLYENELSFIYLKVMRRICQSSDFVLILSNRSGSKCVGDMTQL